MKVQGFEICSLHSFYLDRCDGSLLGGGDTLLHGSHVSSKGRLVTNSRWDTTKQSRHFAAGMGEPEDVVDEEKHVLTLLVAEILGNGQTGKSNTSTSAWGARSSVRRPGRPWRTCP